MSARVTRLSVACLPCALAACSQILGLTAPHGQADAGADAGSGSAMAGFTLRVTTAAPRVPQNGFDFLAVAVTRTGFAGDIAVDIPVPPAGVTVTAATIAAGSDAGTLQLAGAAALSVGSDLPLELVATGGATTQDLDFTAVVTLKPGVPDPGFGSAGNGIVAIAPLNEGNFFADFAIAPNGTLTAVGGSEGTGPLNLGVIARVTKAGAFDPTFGSGGSGFDLLALGSASNAFAQFTGVARQSSGIVVAAGQGPVTNGSSSVAWLASVDQFGAVATEFGNVGNDLVSGHVAIAVVALADDDLVAVTSSDGGFGASSIEMVRSTSNGNPDTTFNGGAPLPLGISFPVFGAGALAVDPTGATTYACGSGSDGASVVHITAAGAFDPAFGSNGVVALGSAAAAATAVVAQPDGNILVAGAPAFVARLLPSGAFDPGFGVGGVASLGATTFSQVDAVAVQSDGRIVVAGTNGQGATELVRLLPDGAIDPSYGNAGVTFVSSFSLFNLRLQPDDSAVGCGLFVNSDPLPAALLRVTP
jgi:uncharacterized delta-60 repeat protein